MNFQNIFEAFLHKKTELKVINVASCTRKAKPNSASKMLVDIKLPNIVYFLDYTSTQSYHNIMENPQISVSFMDDAAFTGYRLTGPCGILQAGPEYEQASKSWERRQISYEAERIIQRMTGRYSTREGERSLPKDFVIMKLEAAEGSVVKPDRIFRAAQGENPSADDQHRSK